MKDLNVRVDVVPFSNCCVYLVAQPPITAPGIPSDFIVFQLDAEHPRDLKAYVRQHSQSAKLLMEFLWDIANRVQDNIEYLLVYLGSGTVFVSPSKKALMLLDDGGSGKTTLSEFVLKAVSPRYYFHTTLYFCLLLKHFVFVMQHARGSDIPRKLVVGSEKSGDEYLSENYSRRHHTFGVSDESTHTGTGVSSTASAIKINRLINDTGRFKSKIREHEVVTRPVMSMIFLNNSLKITGLNSATADRFIVHAPLYTSKESMLIHRLRQN